MKGMLLYPPHPVTTRITLGTPYTCIRAHMYLVLGLWEKYDIATEKSCIG